MANKFTWKIEGIQEFEEQIAKLAQMHKADAVIRATFAKAIRNALAPTAEMSKAAAPYDELFNTSGIHLRDTIRVDGRIPSNKDQQSAFVHPNDIAIGIISAKKSAVSLSHEFGNARTQAKFFLRNPFEQDRENITDRLKSELAEIIPRYAKNLQKRKLIP